MRKGSIPKKKNPQYYIKKKLQKVYPKNEHLSSLVMAEYWEGTVTGSVCDSVADILY